MIDTEKLKKLRPVGQFDKNSCWAACLSWWLKSMSVMGKKRLTLSQSNLIVQFDKYAQPDGGISTHTFMNLVCTDARFKLKATKMQAADLPFVEISDPRIIVYNYPEAGGTHMNVIFNQQQMQVGCMEPFYPVEASDGKRHGRVLSRPLTHFMSSSEIIIARAAD